MPKSTSRASSFKRQRTISRGHKLNRRLIKIKTGLTVIMIRDRWMHSVIKVSVKWQSSKSKESNGLSMHCNGFTIQGPGTVAWMIRLVQ